MKIRFKNNTVRLYEGDNLQVLPFFKENFFDSCITDPPYGINFMNKIWDYAVPNTQNWKEVYRVLKPGAHLLAFFSTRTYHRGVVNIEDSGFEIRDQIGWIYSSGLPKSQDISKAIDKRLGCKREQIKTLYDKSRFMQTLGNTRPWLEKAKKLGYYEHDNNIPVSEQAKKWNGWGSYLKPAWECIVVARKPFKGSLIDNVLKHGVGGLNVDKSRVAHERFPANIIHDGSAEVIAEFAQYGKTKSYAQLHLATGKSKNVYGARRPVECCTPGGSGYVSRFFYCAKAAPSERGNFNNHPTVKPLGLITYLIRLVTPQGGKILDPYCGSGTTLLAALKTGYECYGIDINNEYCNIAIERLRNELVQCK